VIARDIVIGPPGGAPGGVDMRTLDIEDLVVRYGPFLALDGVSMRVEQGEIVGLIGPNGAGKSSLVRAVGGLVRPVAGSIRFKDQPMTDVPAHRRTALGLSIVPEGRGLFSQMSVLENLQMGGYALALAEEMEARMERCFRLFPILADRRRQLAGTLSGGQQQMLAVSVGLMAHPELCILDEPSLGLAPIVIRQIGETLKSMRDAGLTVLLVEQNARLTCDVADRIYVMQSGRIRYHDSPQRLFENREVLESFLSV
jgi:branched-chain amino acid transport system ATP-binding protein